jgi:hypothetical protein
MQVNEMIMAKFLLDLYNYFIELLKIYKKL